MSARAEQWAWQMQYRQGPAARGVTLLVLLAMAHQANDEGVVASPCSLNALADKCGVVPRTVTTAVRNLVSLGDLEVLAKGSGRQETSYCLKLK